MYVLLLSIMALGRIVECFIAKYRKKLSSIYMDRVRGFLEHIRIFFLWNNKLVPDGEIQ